MVDDGMNLGGRWIQLEKKHFHSISPSWDVFSADKIKIRNGSRNISFFFFSHFPDKCNARDFFDIFGYVGEGVEVAIAPRKNNFGKRFGFARFTDVDDVFLLGVKLDNIMVDGRKIHANTFRFERKSVHPSRNQVVKFFYANFHLTLGGGGLGGCGFIKGNKTFSQVIYVGENAKCDEQANYLTFFSKEEVKHRLEKAYVGRVNIPGSTFNLQTCFEMEGYYAVKITLFGQCLCLMEESEEGFIDQLTGEGESWWKSIFSTINRWKPEEIDGEILVWIRIFGIPYHAWNEDFFVSISNLMGSLVCMNKVPTKGLRRDSVRL